VDANDANAVKYTAVCVTGKRKASGVTAECDLTLLGQKDRTHRYFKRKQKKDRYRYKDLDRDQDQGHDHDLKFSDLFVSTLALRDKFSSLAIMNQWARCRWKDMCTAKFVQRIFFLSGPT
jgi:hypothetical protein